MTVGQSGGDEGLQALRVELLGFTVLCFLPSLNGTMGDSTSGSGGEDGGSDGNTAVRRNFTTMMS